jgi:hypothetical protein
VTLARFLAGILLSLFALVPIGLAAQAARRLLLPDWRGVEARLVDIVLALASITVVTEALGTIGWFSPLPVSVGLALTGCVGWLVARRHLEEGADDDVERVGDDSSVASEGSVVSAWLPTATAVVGALLVTGAWLARTVRSIEHGMNTVDTFWYHLPVAVRFVQTGRITSIQYLDMEPVTAFFPATSSLYHGIGVLLFRTDLVSTVINIGWLALALAAAWCVGRPFGIAPATTLGAALLLGTPGLVATQPGGAYNDVAGLALLLTAVAVAVRGPAEPRTAAQDFIAALAAGLALGMKFTFVVPAAALCIGLALTAPRGARARRAIVVLVGAASAGGYWYVRNAVATGNPLPSLSAGVGPLALPNVKGRTATSTVAAFLFDGRAWRENFLPGLRSSLGPAWIAVVVFALAGMVIATVQSTQPRLRMLGIVGVVSAAGYLFTPQYLLGGFGRPFFFAANVRYGSPALAVGLVLFPIALRRWWSWVLGAYMLALVVTQLDPTSWPTGFPWVPFSDRVSGADAGRAVAVLVVASVVAFAAFAVRRLVPAARARSSLAALGIPVALLLALACVHGSYLAHRYTDTGPFPKVYAWGRDIRDARVAVAGGYMQAQYPMAGLDLSNYVQYAGVRTSGGGWRPVENCREWVHFLESGRYEYVVLGPAKGLEQWTEAQPDARLTLTQTLGSDVVVVRIFRLDPNRAPRSCDSL